MGTNDKETPGPAGGGHAASPQDEAIKKVLEQIRHPLMVMSGKGGVGKSSVSAGLAVVLAARGFQVGLLDIDIHGPSLARMMGLQGPLDISTEQKVIPKQVDRGPKVVSMQSLMTNPDQAVIWRGPAKTGVIRQFVGDVQWGKLDFLVIDAPPGTGDEPLSVAQTVPQALALIVTTPQEVALADVRKSINFCRAVHMEILGLVENMGPFACPCCGKQIALFKEGGGEATAARMQIPFLGSLPFDPTVVKLMDKGEPMRLHAEAPLFAAALESVVEKMMTMDVMR